MSLARLVLAVAVLVVASLGPSPAVGAGLAEKEFVTPELYVSTTNVDARTLMEALPNRAAWSRFFETHGAATAAFVDPRSGATTNLILRVPLIPGTGVGNRVGLKEVGRKLDRPVERIDASVVGDLVRGFIETNREVLGIDGTQLGSAVVGQVTEELWQVSIPQVVDGIPVRDGRIAATVSHGNLVLLGTEKWGDVALDTKPRIQAEAALAAAFEHVGGRVCTDALWKEPTLEIVAVAPAGFDPANISTETIGKGYGHRLVWTFGFSRNDEFERWELLVDAHDGRVLAFHDTMLHAARQISGGVYPATSTDVCPSPDRCGTLQSGWPMPYADTGLPPPRDYTSGAGVFDYPGSGTVMTTLNGRYVEVVDGCGPLLESSAIGDLDLGGLPGQHNCHAAGSAGNTSPARTVFYELNRMIEMARGWLPLNAWLSDTITAYVNQGVGPGVDGCGAFGGDSLTFFHGHPGYCLNAAEVATLISHEWGHGLDVNDAIGVMSQSSEAYADIAATYRAQSSCVFYGWRGPSNRGCGVTSDGTGMNRNEANVPGLVHCDLDCSGSRDVDWHRHADQNPDTPQNFSCEFCTTGGFSPCGTEVHCDARPVTQAAWDFAARDLQAPPFNLSRTDAFVVASRIFFQGSGNIGLWHACSCGAGTSDGCGATNAYMQWLAADDDDGDLSNGTPHQTALYAAFQRHNVACDTLEPQNHGCAGGPTAAPAVVTAASNNRVDLSWSEVPGAIRYRVLRTEGHAGCDLGKTVIAETTGPSYADTDLANGRSYEYVVHAVGANGSCFGPSNDCQAATPVHCAGSISLQRDRFRCTDTLGLMLEDWDLRDTGSHAVSVGSTSEPAPETVLLAENPAGSGRFTGTLAITSAPTANGDGSISVADGDTLTIGYLDASRCGAPAVPVERIARIDCRGPAIANVRATDIQGTEAVIRWETAEPSDSRVTYGTAAPPDRVSDGLADLVTSHVVRLEGLSPCTAHVFSVGSTDEAGNPSVDDNGGGFFGFETVPETTPVFAAPGPPMTIPVGSFGGARATITVSEADVVVDVSVKVKIVHPAVEDLVLSLIGPDHTTVVLATRRGVGDDYDDTVFDDEASLGIASGEAPFAGSFRPEQPLSALDGKVSSGEWTLRVADDGGYLGTGTLQKFELNLAYPPRDCGPSLGLESRNLSDVCVGSAAGGGNGIVEPGETVQVVVHAANHEDTLSATGVSARLSSFTPGVFVTSSFSTYPDLAPGAAAPGAMPYILYVDPTVACGTPIVLRLDGTSNEGDWKSVLTLRVGEPDPATATYFNGTDRPITDLATTRSYQSVVDSGLVQDVDVGLSISHGSLPDLDIFLVGPDGTRVELSTDNGGFFATSYSGTIFDDEGATPITAGSAPFTERFRPESPLSLLDGKPVNGTWTLEVTDDRALFPGTLLEWSLTLERLEEFSCETCPIGEPPPEVPSLAWSGSGKDTLVWSAIPRATAYRLHRGAAFDLPALLDAGADSCERTAGSTPTSGPVLTESPAPGSFYWFLVRAENAIGAGPSGEATTGPRVLDASGACP